MGTLVIFCGRDLAECICGRVFQLCKIEKISNIRVAKIEETKNEITKIKNRKTGNEIVGRYYEYF